MKHADENTREKKEKLLCNLMSERVLLIKPSLKRFDTKTRVDFEGKNNVNNPY